GSKAPCVNSPGMGLPGKLWKIIPAVRAGRAPAQACPAIQGEQTIPNEPDRRCVWLTGRTTITGRSSQKKVRPTRGMFTEEVYGPCASTEAAVSRGLLAAGLPRLTP